MYQHHHSPRRLRGFFCLTAWLFIWLIPTQLLGQDSIEREDYRSLIRSVENRHNARIGLSLIRCRDRQNIYPHRANELLTPASVVKTISTGAALRTRGANYRYTTTAYYTNKVSGSTLHGDINIYGSADPSIGSRYITNSTQLLDEIATSLDSLGVTQVLGNINLYTALGEPSVPDSWMLEDLNEPYGAGLYGLNYADNTIGATLSSPRAKGAVTLTEDQRSGLIWQNAVRWSKHGGGVKVDLNAQSSEVRLSGVLARGGQRRLRISNPSPALALGHQLVKRLGDRGITVRGKVVAQYKPSAPQGKHLLTYYSPTLSELCRVTNHQSHNLYAEAIGSLLTTKRHAHKGEAITEYWVKRLNLPKASIRLVDGSGLSRLNQVTPQSLAIILLDLMGGYMPNDGTLVETLPEVGVEGTVKSLAQPYGLTSYLKSGTMRGVSCYAGYIFHQNEWYVLAYMSNGMPSARQSRDFLYTLLENIFDEAPSLP